MLVPPLQPTPAPPPRKSAGAASPTEPAGLLENEIKQVKKIVKHEHRRLGKIPLLLPLLASFGLVSTFYGFEKILDQTSLVDQPLVMISIGVVLLLVTGTAAQKL